MSKLFTVLSVFVLLSFQALAQGDGRPQPRPIEERVKQVMEKLAPLQLSASQVSQTDSVFTDFYRSSDKFMEEMRSSGNFDREAMQAKRKELSEVRDEKLKKIWNENQYKKFKEEIEESLRPQRRGN